MIIKNIQAGPVIKDSIAVKIDYVLDKSIHDGPTYIRVNEIISESLDQTRFGMSVDVSRANKVFPMIIFKVNRLLNRNDAHTSTKLKIFVYDDFSHPKYTADGIVDFKINWPEIGNISYSGKGDDKLYLEARNIIDDIEKKNLYVSLNRTDWIIRGKPKSAKEKLEFILDRNPGYVKAYHELVRYHIVTGGVRHGIEQAERLIDAALIEDDKNAETYVYRGFIYTVQKKYKQAETSFKTAERLGSKNLWLYANRGNLYLKIGKETKAISEYKKVISHKRKNNRDDLPIEYSYRTLISLLSTDKRWKTGNTIHEKRIREFPERPCFLAEYANHLLLFSSEHDRAFNLAKKAKRLQCKQNTLMESALAMAHIMKWYDLHEANKTESNKYYNRAQVSIKNMSTFIATLAYTKKTRKVLKKLVEIKNIDIDSRGKNDETALLIYIQLGDTGTVSALLRLGADPNSKHFNQDVTPLMLAVFQKDLNILKQLLNYGGNPNSKDKKGKTVLDYAKKNNRKDAINELIKHGAV